MNRLLNATCEKQIAIANTTRKRLKQPDRSLTKQRHREQLTQSWRATMTNRAMTSRTMSMTSRKKVKMTPEATGVTSMNLMTSRPKAKNRSYRNKKRPTKTDFN